MNHIQELQIELLKEMNFNACDGKKVAADLIAHPDLWRGAITMCFALHLVPLRDIDRGDWHTNTLYITPQPGRDEALKQLAKTWHADDVHWIGGEEAGAEFGTNFPEIVNNPKVFLLVWWN